jgi:hypothetical protein
VSDLVQSASASSTGEGTPRHSGLLNISLDSVEQAASDPSGISGCFACSLSCCHQHGGFILHLTLHFTTNYTIHSATRFQQDRHLPCPVFNLLPHQPTRETPQRIL